TGPETCKKTDRHARQPPRRNMLEQQFRFRRRPSRDVMGRLDRLHFLGGRSSIFRQIISPPSEAGELDNRAKNVVAPALANFQRRKIKIDLFFPDAAQAREFFHEWREAVLQSVNMKLAALKSFELV